MYLDGSLRTNLFWKHSCMAASQNQLQTYIRFRNSYTYFTFLTLTSCQRGADFYDFFLSKCFGEKCKQAELALNFVKNRILVK